MNGVLLRDGASPTFSNNLLKGNGQYGAALIDCRGRGVLLDDNNEVVRNGKGAVSGQCDDDELDDVGGLPGSVSELAGTR